jgi:hypothetical protein
MFELRARRSINGRVPGLLMIALAWKSTGIVDVGTRCQRTCTTAPM